MEKKQREGKAKHGKLYNCLKTRLAMLGSLRFFSFAKPKGLQPFFKWNFTMA